MQSCWKGRCNVVTFELSISGHWMGCQENANLSSCQHYISLFFIKKRDKPTFGRATSWTSWALPQSEEAPINYSSRTQQRLSTGYRVLLTQNVPDSREFCWQDHITRQGFPMLNISLCFDLIYVMWLVWRFCFREKRCILKLVSGFRSGLYPSSHAQSVSLRH